MGELAGVSIFFTSLVNDDGDGDRPRALESGVGERGRGLRLRERGAARDRLSKNDLIKRSKDPIRYTCFWKFWKFLELALNVIIIFLL